MKNILLTIIAFILLTSCCESFDGYYEDTQTNTKYDSYDDYCEQKVNSLTPPLIVIGIDETMGGHSLSIIDGDKKIHTFGDMSSFGNNIAETHKVGDTIVK